MWRSISLFAFAGTLLVALCSERLSSAREKLEAKKDTPAKKTPQDYGLVEVDEDKATYPTEKLGAPTKGFDEKRVIRIIPYELLGGPIIFHGTLYVMDNANDTFTDGTVSRGPNGGSFFGKYRLTKGFSTSYIYDDTTLFRRHRLEIMIDFDNQFVAFREEWRILGIWQADMWHVLVTW